MEQTTDSDATGRETGRELVGRWTTSVAGLLLGVVALLVFYALVQFWPPAPAPPLAGQATATTGTTTTGTTTAPGVTTTTAPGGSATGTTVVLQGAPNPAVSVFWMDLDLSRETRLFYVVALAGALGGLVHAMRSLSWYTGNRNLKASWLLTYALLPVVAASMAVIVYVVLRGGLILVSTQTSPDVVNPFGFAALAALVGLFSPETAEWLRRIFEQVFTQAMKGKDPAVAVRIVAIDPEHGVPGTPVRLTGSGLADVASVTFNALETTEVQQLSDTELIATVPEGATSGPIRVRSPAGTATSPVPFTVDPVPREDESGTTSR
jgi:hypothetical protein